MPRQSFLILSYTLKQQQILLSFRAYDCRKAFYLYHQQMDVDCADVVLFHRIQQMMKVTSNALRQQITNREGTVAFFYSGSFGVNLNIWLVHRNNQLIYFALFTTIFIYYLCLLIYLHNNYLQLFMSTSISRR